MPQIPPAACTWQASIGSSTPSFYVSLHAREYAMLPTRPIKNAAHGSHLSQIPVTETEPTRIPFVSAPTSYLCDYEYVPMIRGLRKAELTPPEHPEIRVHIMIFGAPLLLGANIFIVDPPLKNSQQTKRRIVPNTVNGNEFISLFSPLTSSDIHHSTSAGLFYFFNHSIVSFYSKTFLRFSGFFSLPNRGPNIAAPMNPAVPPRT